MRSSNRPPSPVVVELVPELPPEADVDADVPPVPAVPPIPEPSTMKLQAGIASGCTSNAHTPVTVSSDVPTSGAQDSTWAAGFSAAHWASFPMAATQALTSAVVGDDDIGKPCKQWSR
jgi:hypothetical protein